MSVCFIVLTLTLACMGSGDRLPTTVEAAAPAEDRWIAEDKLRHFALSFAATQMGYGGARFALEPDPAVAAAAAAAVGLGVAKEVRDLRLGGPFSLKDLAWDGAGVALGVFLVRRVR